MFQEQELVGSVSNIEETLSKFECEKTLQQLNSFQSKNNFQVIKEIK